MKRRSIKIDQEDYERLTLLQDRFNLPTRTATLKAIIIASVPPTPYPETWASCKQRELNYVHDWKDPSFDKDIALYETLAHPKSIYSGEKPHTAPLLLTENEEDIIFYLARHLEHVLQHLEAREAKRAEKYYNLSNS